MELNFPFAKLFREKLVPLLARGHIVGISGLSVEWTWNEESQLFDEKMMGTTTSVCDPYILMRHMAEIVEKAPNHSSVTLDSQCYMLCADIDASFPRLECGPSHDGSCGSFPAA